VAMDQEQVKWIDEFREYLKTSGKSRDTIASYPSYALGLGNFCGDLLKVNEDVLAAYLKHLQDKGIGRSSVRRYFSSLSTFYDFLVFKKHVSVNPITSTFKKFYLKDYKSHDTKQRRQIISIAEARSLIKIIPLIREKAPVVLLFKTGIRRKELSELDVSDLDLANLTLHIKPTGKRSNEIVFFDEETRLILEKWLVRRQKMAKDGTTALFLNSRGGRLKLDAIDDMFVKHAKFVGLHDPDSARLEDKLTPHCCRRWFGTHLRRAGMPREFIKQLRGDVGREAIDGYDHIDQEELKDAYLHWMPQLGI
jgi:integrase/recombinase XerD